MLEFVRASHNIFQRTTSVWPHVLLVRSCGGCAGAPRAVKCIPFREVGAGTPWLSRGVG